MFSSEGPHSSKGHGQHAKGSEKVPVLFGGVAAIDSVLGLIAPHSLSFCLSFLSRRLILIPVTVLLHSRVSLWINELHLEPITVAETQPTNANMQVLIINA